MPPEPQPTGLAPGPPSPAGPLPTACPLPTAGPLTPAEALALFDRLAPVGVDELLGSWRGSSMPTGHPLDGVLERCHWHGKRFEGAEAVHPLVFRAPGGGLVSLEPRWLMPALPLLLRWPILRGPLLVGLFTALLPLLTTQRPRARLRLCRCRGVESAAMLYDHAPIIDAFRRLDDDTLLGLMDLRGMEQPFFFLLRREP